MTVLDRVAAAPISWGICEAPGWGLQLSVDRVLGEARELGITAFEQGSIGWLPGHPEQLSAKLDEYGMTLIGGFVPLVLHDPDVSTEMLGLAARFAENLAAAGGTYFNTAVVGSLEEWFRPEMDARSWGELFDNLARLDEICSAHGVVQAVHPHVDTLIERVDELQRFVDSCATKVCFDTGHLTIGGADPVAFANDHLDRVALVHLKDVDGEVAARERSGELDLAEATREGLFPTLGNGIVEVAEVIAALEGAGYEGWYVMETDVALMGVEPPAGEGPVLGVAGSLGFLCELAGRGAVA